MNEMESAVVGLEGRLVEAQQTVDALVRTFRRLRQATKVGHVTEIEKNLAAVAERGQELLPVLKDLPQAWAFDARSHLTAGYAAELKAAAAEVGVDIIERDGRLYAFPLLIRIEPRDAVVQIGKKVERRLRPKEVAKQLASGQKRPQRFREQAFLELLYRAYKAIAGHAWRKNSIGVGPTIPLAEIHAILTLLPGSDYPIEDFGRDLLLLDRQPLLRTRDGCRFTFPGAAISRERVQRITTYDEKGRERTYIGLSFVKD